MKIKLRNYENNDRFGTDYQNIYDFLRRINQNQYDTPNFLWARWSWMISRPVDNENLKNKIGIWEDEGKIVALVTFELTFGEVFICVDHNYDFLKEDILNYAKEYLSNEGKLKVIISDSDRQLQELALNSGFRPTQYKQYVSVLDINDKLKYNLPSGFKVVSMADSWDYYKYNRVMWRGSNHEGEPSQEDEDIQWRKTMLSSPHINPKLIIAIAAPDGNYASHCGLWYIPGDKYAYVEPVATDPEYRKMGLGKAAVYESILRAKELGAKEAIVISSQQFYYNLGFKPFKTETWWE
ncbi:GNAT family N-acetyltransferase [Mobilitalea sibirica]|uniref:GNAT family N-acetyltransferase n=1 Tax=Mobilitalea sibirica TaxID=1462919 RepID=A0A8J7L244_9FIRM|nr:GNAT family N-acetyltransferase [Mobilitalea sibirica]MBH1939908.1 GNAT family N-acetyltransferase [Mobilitalea sibirica]